MKWVVIFTISFFTIGLAGSLIYAAIDIKNFQKDLLLETELELIDIAKERAMGLDIFLEEQYKLFDELRKSDVLFARFLEASPQDEEYDVIFAEVLKVLDSISAPSAGVINLNGTIIANKNRVVIGNEFKVRHDFERVINSERNYFIHDCGDLNNVHLAITNSVRNEVGDLVGIIGMEVSWKKLSALVDFPEDVDKNIESYLIDNELFLLTPSRFLKGDNRGVFTQIIDSENAKTCFDESVQNNFTSASFLNYRGVEVFGISKNILEKEMCLLVEVDEESLLATSWLEGLWKNVVFIIVVTMILGLIGFFIGRYFDKKEVRNK